MKIYQNAIQFFTEERYNSLKYKFLTRKDYKNFARACNKARCEYLINNKEGYAFPVEGFALKIEGVYRPNGVRAFSTKGAYELNRHSMGWLYRCKLKMLRPRYNPEFNLDKPNQRLRRVHWEIYRFEAHRENIKQGIKRKVFDKTANYEHTNK